MGISHSYFQFSKSAGQLYKALHGDADLRDTRAEYHEKWSQSGYEHTDPKDRVPLAFAHAVQLINKSLDRGDDLSDRRHKGITE